MVVDGIAEACQTACPDDKSDGQLEPPHDSGFLACCIQSAVSRWLGAPAQDLRLSSRGAALAAVGGDPGLVSGLADGAAVARELGHESEAMVRRVYAHLGEIRHRSEVLEYRVEQHLERLGDRLQRLGLVGPFVTGNVTAEMTGAGTTTPATTQVSAGRKVQRSGPG